MHFDSYEFVFAFLPITLLLYLVFRRRIFVNIILLVASYIFYAYDIYGFLVLLIIASLIDFFLGARIAATESKRLRAILLWSSVAMNIGLLAFFKYGAWAAPAINDGFAFLGLGIVFTPLVAATPPGLSFYTFQTLSYTIDIYRRQMKPARSFVDYMTFVAFFPQLVAGPIERASSLLPQLSRVRDLVSKDTALFAIFLICWGLFKKIVFADNFGSLVDQVLYLYPNAAAQSAYPGAGLILMYAFGFQIYCDFSAYTDIARGAAMLFGVELSRNFLTPYFTSNPSEFWHRWHISLSTWIRDYVYIPMGGNHRGLRRTIANLILTMGLGGLWHGAGVMFILWGLYHGVLLAVYRVLPVDRLLIRLLGAKLGRSIAIFIFFHLVFIGWIWFRTDVETAPVVLKSIYLFFQYPLNDAFWDHARVLVLFVLPILMTEYIGFRRSTEFVDLFKEWSTASRTVLLVVMFYGILMFGKRVGYDFIYFQF